MSRTDTMTPTEIQAACVELARLAGPIADVTVRVCGAARDKSWRTGRMPVQAVCYLDHDFREQVSVEAETFDDALAALRVEIERDVEQRDVALVRKLALAIIEHADHAGRVSDAALRLVAPTETVERLRDRALAEADRLAARGPYSVLSTALANAETVTQAAE